MGNSHYGYEHTNSHHMSTTQNGSSYSNTLAPVPSSGQSNGDDAGASPSPSDYTGPSRSRRRHNAKGRPRADTLHDGPDTRPEELQWYRGIKVRHIPEDAPEKEKQRLRAYNERVAFVKTAHTREQNRLSARRSREKKQTTLTEAQTQVQRLEAKNASLQREIQQLKERIADQDRQIVNIRLDGMYRIPSMQPQAFHSYPPPLPRANVHGQTPMPPPSQFPTPIQGPASSPAAGSMRTPGSGQQYGGFMQHQPQSTPPNPNLYQSMMPPQNQMQSSVQSHHSIQAQYPAQPPHGAMQAQSASATQTSFAYGFGATGGSSQAPAHEQHAHTPGTGFQGNIHETPQAHPQGNLHPSLQGNPQGNAQGNFPNTLSEKSPEHTSGIYLGNSTEQEQQEQQGQQGQQEQQEQQQQDERNVDVFETGPIDPTLEFMNFGSPLNPETPAQNKPTNAG
ncbi:hypothetical protein Hte_000366 [Hypoxylon texense]